MSEDFRLNEFAFPPHRHPRHFEESGGGGTNVTSFTPRSDLRRGPLLAKLIFLFLRGFIQHARR